jgi:hypothetical protein
MDYSKVIYASYYILKLYLIRQFFYKRRFQQFLCQKPPVYGGHFYLKVSIDLPHQVRSTGLPAWLRSL